MIKGKIWILLIIGTLCIALGIYGLSQDNNNSDKQDENTSNIEEKLGSYNNIEISEKSVAEKYFSEIQKIIINENYNSLDLIIDRNYEEYKALSSEKINNVIMNKGFMGKELEIINYEKQKYDKYNNVYVFNTKIKDESINIKESSPNVYSVSFK